MSAGAMDQVGSPRQTASALLRQGIHLRFNEIPELTWVRYRRGDPGFPQRLRHRTLQTLGRFSAPQALVLGQERPALPPAKPALAGCQKLSCLSPRTHVHIRAILARINLYQRLVHVFRGSSVLWDGGYMPGQLFKLPRKKLIGAFLWLFSVFPEYTRHCS